MAGYTVGTRLAQPSSEQVEVLLSYLETRLDLARGVAKTRLHKELFQKDWFQICLKLNNMPGGTVKSVKRWMKYWSDKKWAVKKKHAEIEKYGDNEDIPPLSATEERVLSLIQAYTSASQIYSPRVKKEPLDQSTDASSLNDTVTAFILEQPMEEENNEHSNDSEEGYLSAYRINGPTTQSKQENHAPTVSSTRLDPSSDQQSSFLLVADKLCQIEQQRLELDRRMLDVVERNSERDLLLAEAVKAMGEGLKALAEAIAKK